MNVERPVCLNLANLGPLENSSAPSGSHRVVLTRGAAHRYMVRFSPLDFCQRQGGTTRSLDPVWSWRAFPMSNQPRNCGTLGDTSTSSGERIHFLVKPSTFVGIWRRLRIFSCLFFFFTLHPFPLLLHVPGLYTALWSDYSSSGLITVNEGLRTGL